MGRAYAEAALPKAAVTPEIAALADEITQGIAGRREQAMAIDAWMKKNIRYVAVYLAAGRVVPNDAESILRNRFGDCKDKATLMSALLAAKGIASEQALISFGGAYTLPEPPTMVALNHVIVYVPEFDLYTDPTAQLAGFGVLAAETYDKPVVRVSAAGAVLARTPAMKSQEHVADVHTTLTVAADGTISGRTVEHNTGILAMAMRGPPPPSRWLVTKRWRSGSCRVSTRPAAAVSMSPIPALSPSRPSSRQASRSIRNSKLRPKEDARPFPSACR